MPDLTITGMAEDLKRGKKWISFSDGGDVFFNFNTETAVLTKDGIDTPLVWMDAADPYWIACNMDPAEALASVPEP